jgi:hypothetical protein
MNVDNCFVTFKIEIIEIRGRLNINQKIKEKKGNYALQIRLKIEHF